MASTPAPLEQYEAVRVIERTTVLNAGTPVAREVPAGQCSPSAAAWRS